MTRRPGETEPDPPGGRAAERLRDFLAGRFPDGPPGQGPSDEATEAPSGAEGDDGDRGAGAE